MTTMTTEEELALIRKNKLPGSSPAPAGMEVPTADDLPPDAPLPPPRADMPPPDKSEDWDRIDAELGLTPAEIGLTPLPDEDAGWFDVMGAAWNAYTVEEDTNGFSARLAKERAVEMFEMLPAADQEALKNTTLRRGMRGVNWDRAIPAIIDAAKRAAGASPDEQAKWAGYALTPEDFYDQIDQQRLAEWEEAQAILDQPGGTVPAFLGMGARAIVDPINLAMAPFGLVGSLTRRIVSEAALGGLAEAVALPTRYRVAEELNLPDPNPVAQIGMGMVFGGGFALALAGLGKGVRALKSRVDARSASIKETLPEGVDRIDHEHAIEAAEAELRGDQTVTERLGLVKTEGGGKVEGGARAEGPAKGTLGDILAQPTAGGLPPVTADAPAGWEQIRNGIFAGESGADWNALYGYQNRKGGKFSTVKPTEMTLDQWLEFQDPSGVYGQWVARNRPDPENGVATPMGAYQIVGTTLRAAKKGLGLKGDEVMTPEMQDYVAQWIYREQGSGAWVGYKGPRDSYTPGTVDGPAPDMGGTVRGYTGEGQVAVGDGMRIDVGYEVVDYASLIRASGDLQPRDRSRINSDAWVADTAARLDPAQLMPSPTADRGTPIVGPDNVIESGNGRTMAIARAYERHPDRAEAYRGAIEAAGYTIPEGVDQPVLIARRRTDLTADQRRQMVIDAQDSGVAQMTPTEVARATARNLQSPILSQLDPNWPIGHEINGGFVRAALATLPRSARNAMFDPSGALNANGQRQLREALFARAWDAPDILARYTEGAPAELKSLMEALETAAPSWAALKADIEAGLVTPEMDISGFVLDAMRLIGAARDVASAEQARRAIVPKGQRAPYSVSDAIQELLDEVDLIQGPVSPLTTAIVKKMWPNGRAAPADDVASFLTRYADEARKAGAAGGMFDAPTPRDVLTTIDKETFGNLPEDLGRSRGFATRVGSEAPPEAVATPSDLGFDRGAQSPEAEAVHAEIEAQFEARRRADLGPSYPEFRNNPEGAIEKLLAEKTGETPAAIMIDGIGEVSFVWGSKVLGLRHILEKHGEAVVRDLPRAMREGKLGPEYNGRRDLITENTPQRKTVLRLDWTGDGKPWVLTSHDVIQGTDAQPGRTSNGLTETAPPSVPGATAQREGNPSQPVAQEPDPITAELAAMRSDLGEFAEFEIDLPDGTKARAGDILDDLDADRTADAVIQACATSTNGAPA